MKKRILILLICFLIFNKNVFAQVRKKMPLLDSLTMLLRKDDSVKSRLHKTTYDKADTARVILLNAIAPELINKGEHEKALALCNEAVTISSKIGFKLGLYNAYNNTGVLYSDQSDFSEALKNLFAALKIGQELKIKKNIANTSSNIANIYAMQGNFPSSLQYNLEALKIREELNDRRAIANSYNNIGKVNAELGNNKEALKYHVLALKIREEIGDKKGLLTSYINFGNIYNKSDNYEAALENYFKALRLAKELNDRIELANLDMNIGTVYSLKGKMDSAILYTDQALALQKKIGNKYGITQCYINQANTFIAKSENDISKKYLDSAVELSKEIEAYDLTKLAYKILTENDTATNNWQSAYFNFNNYIRFKDSLFNQENTEKIVQVQMQYEFDKKEAAAKLEQEKKDLAIQKEMALKAIQFEYQQKQAAAKSEKEKQQLKYEQQIEEQQLADEYTKKIALANEKQQHEKALNTVLAKENYLMQQNSLNEARVRWLMILALVAFTAFGISYYRNFKKQKAANAQILKQSEELKILMQEVHHRVKNNLQLISSLLELQGMRLTDDAAKSAFEEGQSRVQSIAILHHQLYQHDDLSIIELNSFVAELLRQISGVFRQKNQEIEIINSIPEALFDIDTALPLGLIINELATNSFKYAHTFSNNQQVNKLVIKIDLLKHNENNLTLVYQDNGKGLPEDFAIEKAKSLGLRIVTRLAKQVKGSCVYENNNGAKFSISFLKK